MKRLLLPLLLSTLGTIILFVGAAMHGGMCHCMTAKIALFPYGRFVIMMIGWDSFGLLLALLQFPVYAVIITVVNGVRWKMIVLLFIVILHVGAASFALRDYCQSRRRCAAAPSNKRLQRTGISVSLIDDLPLMQLSPGR